MQSRPTATLTSSDPVLAAFADDVDSAGAVAVEGGRTRWALGGDPPPEVRLVRAPTGIVAYEPAEMTVRVRAGTPVAELHEELAARGQRTPLPDRGGTVGGAFAVGENHPGLLGRGLVRTALLQVRYVSAEGRLVNGGGPTVKNVTGFDLPRLMAGSLGTLGLLAEVIVRTDPMPAASQWLVADDADPFAVRQAVLRPGAVLWDGSRTAVLLEGHAPDIAAERAALAAHGTFAETDVPTLTATATATATAMAASTVASGAGAAASAGAAPWPVLPEHRWSLTPAGLRTISELDTGPFVAVVGSGLVFASRPQPSRVLTPGVRTLTDRVKQNFDPTGRLNPGRDPGVR